jgi:hypothetical protein
MPAFNSLDDDRRGDTHVGSTLLIRLKMQVRNPWVGRMPETVHPIPHDISPRGQGKGNHGDAESALGPHRSDRPGG